MNPLKLTLVHKKGPILNSGVHDNSNSDNLNLDNSNSDNSNSDNLNSDNSNSGNSNSDNLNSDNSNLTTQIAKSAIETFQVLECFISNVAF